MYIGPDPDNPNLYIYQTAYGERIKSALPPTEFRDHRRGAPGTITPGVAEALPASELPPVPASVGGAPQWIQRGVADPQAAGVLLPSGLTPDELSAMEQQVTASAGGAPQAQGVQDWSAQHAQQLDPQGMEFQQQLAGIGQVVRGEQAPGTLEPAPVAPGLTTEDLGEDDEDAEDEPAAKEAAFPGARYVAGKYGALTKKYETLLKAEKDKYETDLSKIGGPEGDVARARESLGIAEGALTEATNKLKSFEINPQRAFPNAFSKVAAVISVAMGAYAQGLSGGKLPNTALQIIQGAIKNDIDAQKIEFQKLKGLVDEKRNVYAMGMRLLGNAQEAEQFAHTIAYRAYQGQMDKVGKQMGLEEGALRLSAQENYWQGLLYNSRIKNSQQAPKIPKMSKEARKALAGSIAVKEKAYEVGASSQELGESWWLLTWINSHAPVMELDAKTFNDHSQQMTLTVVNALSGLTMTKFEHEKFDKWTPYATDSINRRRQKLNSLLTTMSTRAAGWLKIESPEVKQLFKQENPEMYPLMVGDYAQRNAAVNKFVNRVMGTVVGDPATVSYEGGETVTGR